jgi:hypothetical protein
MAGGLPASYPTGADDKAAEVKNAWNCTSTAPYSTPEHRLNNLRLNLMELSQVWVQYLDLSIKTSCHNFANVIDD